MVIFRKQQEELKEKLQRLESKVLVGGENLLDKADAQRRLLEHAARELEMREMNERRLREDLQKKEVGVCWGLETTRLVTCFGLCLSIGVLGKYVEQS